MSGTSSSLARSWSETVGANALILFFGIATGILAARLLGPDDRGLLAAIMFWPSLLVSLGFLSLGESIVIRANQTSAERRCFLSTTTALSLGLAIPVSVGGALLLPFLLGPDRSDALPLATAYLCAFIPLNFVASALLAVDHAERRFTRYNLLRLLPSGIYFLALLLLWAAGAISVISAIWATWLGTALTAGVRIWTWRNDLGVRPVWQEAMALLRQGVLFHGTTLIMMFSSQADRLVVMRFFDDADIGYYVVALTIATAGLGLVTNSVYTVLFPRLASEPVRAKAEAQLRLGLQRATLFLVVGSGVALIFIPWLLPLLFGSDFVPAVTIAMVLVVAFVPLALRQIIVRCLRAFGDARSGVVAEASALITFIALLPFAYWLGLIGVPLALVGANTVGLAVVCFRLRHHHRICTRAWLLPSRAMLSDAADLASRFHRTTWAAR